MKSAVLAETAKSAATRASQSQGTSPGAPTERSKLWGLCSLCTLWGGDEFATGPFYYIPQALRP